MTTSVSTSRASNVAFWITHFAAPLGAGVAAIFWLQSSGWDRAAIDAAFDPASGKFPWRHHWLTEDVIHTGGKNLVIALAALVALALLASRWKPALVRWRGPLALFLAAVVLGPLATGLGKNLSDARCPWDLARYGGFAVHEHNNAEDGTLGRRGCFPCGQASAGFALTAGYFALRRRRPRAARSALGIGLVYGTILGAGRVLQGAHYPSHVVGTALVCWNVSLGLYALTLKRREDQCDTLTAPIESLRAS
ncbi:MAG: phosphatase PAP2 family protein [Planctomycetes bacterium]|nr:phosphatase PAP2 family protein [Planctomycetota bacterium]